MAKFKGRGLEPGDEGRLLRILLEENPWWDTGQVEARMLPEFHRRDFYKLRDAFEEKPITAIVGPRQVGKTTVMYQLIADLLGKGVAPENIMFLALDFPRLKQVDADPLSAAIELYLDEIVEMPLRSLRTRTYFFFDEVTKAPNWAETLKGWYDRKAPVKFFISDSSEPQVQSGTNSALIGRCSTRLMLPMKFVDYVMYKEGRELWNEVGLRLRDGLVVAIKTGDPAPFYEGASEARRRLRSNYRAAALHLRHYLLKDGFPEILDSDAWDAIGRRLREYVSLIFARDLLAHFKVRDPRALDELTALIADQTAQRFDYAGLAANAGISVDATKEYLHYLEATYLVSTSEFFAGSRAARLKKQRKLYLSNVGLGNALAGRLTPTLFHDGPSLGRVVETLVHDHCRRLLFTTGSQKASQLFYWRNYRGQEVDIVMKVLNRPVPLEVKYQPRITSADLGPALDFLEEFPKSPFGIVVTKETLERRGRVVLVPAPLFLLAV